MLASNEIDRAVRYWDDRLSKIELRRYLNMKIVTRKMKKSAQDRRDRRAEILRAAKEACKKFGGLAIIDDRYKVVDTKYYTITEKGNIDA